MSDPLRMLKASTTSHEMEILREDGLYRHIRFAKPGTSIWHFDLVTWPGHLVITGDLEDYHFARTSDMFSFFRSPIGHINASYWAEKLRGPVRSKTFAPEQFKKRVFEYYRESCRHRPGPHARLWREIADNVLSEDVVYDESTAHHALHHFKYDRFQFTDSWEWDLTDYDYHFLVALHAIVWGIDKYDRAQAVAA